MGIGVAIAAVAVTATVGTIIADIGFAVEEDQLQDELKSAIDAAQTSANKAKRFYEDIFQVVKTSIDKLNQSMKKLPPDVISKLGTALTLDLSDPGNAIQYASYALGGGLVATGIVGGIVSVASSLIGPGSEAAEGILASIGTVAGAAGAVFAVASFGLSLYTGITEINKLKDAISDVNGNKRKSDDVLKKMQDAMDSLLKSMHLPGGKYSKLKEIADDWMTLSAKFDTYSTSFYTAITGFAMGKSQSDVASYLKARGVTVLKDDVLVLAKVIEEQILDMMRQGKTDEQIIDYFAKENPHEGLRFLLGSYFVDSLRQYLKKMSNNQPPYHTPIYTETLQLGEVVEVTSPASGALLDTDFKKDTETVVQQWNLDPSNISNNEYFVKLNHDATLVLQSPTKESERAFICLQGDRNENGGIQVWKLEKVQGSPNVLWTLKNFKTEMYLYLEYSGTPGQTKVPVIVRNASPQDENAQWKISSVQQ